MKSSKKLQKNRMRTDVEIIEGVNFYAKRSESQEAITNHMLTGILGVLLDIRELLNDNKQITKE